ncbi:MAG: hypothetical protein VR74_09160 [Hyphomonas sp. BRH_c22]|uniref:outer membrane beta-barrel protein n=1 Tax=Hyphomonas sp. BRH_c22 TaxID=1629710 RepID=UPI0005F1FAC9|nr:outer membrane beta-barrel protein [Hyphomonas sp. BRH_c22]KJS37340.1 MAG: hypothetical protein VR74_09160 [Hyphomonas sp. BRH_c22]
MSKFKRFCLLSVAASSVMAASAAAQGENYYSRDKYESVLDRRQPAYDPEPIRLGAFLVNSNASASLTYVDNIRATNSNEESGTVARLGMEVAARTNWNVHEIGLDVSAFRNEYIEGDEESSNDLRGRLRGRLNVSRDVSVGGAVFVEDRVEARTDLANASGLDRPIGITRVGASVNANYQSDRFRWTNFVEASQENYEDGREAGTGILVDQDYRDSSTTVAQTRLSYAVSPNLAVYTQGSIIDRSYDEPQFLGGAFRSRDSSGYTVAAGADFELNSLVRGDIAIGYLNEDKDDDYFNDVDGVSVDGRMQWFPSRLTTVGFTAGRRVVDIGVIDSPSALQTNFGARVDHELRRNVILSAEASVSSYDYQEIDRTDDINDLSLTAAYKLSKRVHVEAFARHIARDSSGAGVFGDPSYDVNQIGVGLKLYP